MSITKGTLLSRSFVALLALSLSLGALPCATAGMDDAGSSAACCTRVTGGGDANAPEPGADIGQTLAACPGTCAGTAISQIVMASASVVLAPAPDPRNDRIVGRSLAPDPHPPKSISAA